MWLDIQIDKSAGVFLDLFVELEALLVGQRHGVEIHDDDPAAFQACQFIVAVRFLSPSQAHVETVVDVLGARNAFEIGDQRLLKDKRTYKQLTMVVQPLQVGGDPAEFFVLLWSSRIVFNKADKPAIVFLNLYPRSH